MITGDKIYVNIDDYNSLNDDKVISGGIIVAYLKRLFSENFRVRIMSHNFYDKLLNNNTKDKIFVSNKSKIYIPILIDNLWYLVILDKNGNLYTFHSGNQFKYKDVVTNIVNNKGSSFRFIG